jgi:hypothetical protein
MTTHNTPGTVKERHRDRDGFCSYCSSERAFEPWPCDAARTEAEIARLRAAIDDLIMAGQALLNWYELELWAGPHDMLKHVIDRVAL